MKNSLFYGIVALAIIAFLVGIISYATDIRPKQRGNITAPIQTTVPTKKGYSQEEILRVLCRTHGTPKTADSESTRT